MAVCVCVLQAMESKLLVGGKTIMDHTNEQQKMLELKRQEIAEQVCRGRKSVFPPLLLVGNVPVWQFNLSIFSSVLQIRREREMKQQMMLREEETLEMMETFSSLQQEVELKTKKLRRVR